MIGQGRLARSSRSDRLEIGARGKPSGSPSGVANNPGRPSVEPATHDPTRNSFGLVRAQGLGRGGGGGGGRGRGGGGDWGRRAVHSDQQRVQFFSR